MTEARKPNRKDRRLNVERGPRTAEARADATVELPHTPVNAPNWSENYVFSGFDPAAGIGFYHHMARMPYDPEIWRGAFGVMLPDGQVLVAKDHGRGPSSNGSGPASPSLAFTCREPFRHWDIAYDGVARLTTTDVLTEGLLRDGPTVPVRFDVAFEPSTPPWGFGEGMETEAWADVHYEHSGRFSGTLRYGERLVPLSGTGHRDHSTGPRDVGPMLSHTWVHGEFESGRAFQVFAAHTRPDQRFASAYVADGDQLRAATVSSVPGWQGRDGDPGSFVVSLDTDDGPVEITGRTLPQRYHWSALIPWEFAFGADLDAGPSDPAGPWPVLEAMAVLDWDGERGYGLVEVTRPRSD
jgi:hypothetical protein